MKRAGTLSFPVAVRVVAAEPDLRALDTRLVAVGAAQVPIWLSVPAPSRVDEAEDWRKSLAQLLDRHGAHLTILEVAIDEQPPDVAAYLIRVASTEVRAGHDGVRLALGGRRMTDQAAREAIYTSDVAPYIDLLSVPPDRASLVGSWLTKIDPDARVIVSPQADVPSASLKERLFDAMLQSAGTEVSMRAWPASEALPEALRALAPVAPLLLHDISELDEQAAALQLSIAKADVSQSLGHRLLFDNQTFATYLVYWGDARSDLLDISIRLAVEGSTVVHDLVRGSRRAATDYVRDQESRQVRMRVPIPGGPMLVDFNEGAVDVFAERSDVRGERQLSVEEVIARHRSQQRAQDALVRNYIAQVRMEQHFRPTAADPGYDVVTENRYFVAGSDVEWEEMSFSVNGSKWGSDRPPFPLLQPEKVLSVPLQLRFDEGYRYRLDGNERLDGYDCYVVRFSPVRSDPSLYRGTVWIDRKTFARIRVQAMQGGLAAPVVSNEEVQKYTPPVTVGNREVYLFSGLTARQIMLIAGRNLLVEKSVSFTGFRVNDAQFDEERGAARSSDRVMFKETDSGLRYYVKQNGARVVSTRGTVSAKALAMGVTIDPSFAFPLPIFGINYLDFEFGGPDSQLALLFAGVLAAGNVQRPKLGHTPFDASLDFFAIAVPSTDRVYEPAGERESERLLTWPLSTGANFGWQYTAFQKATFQYQLRYDAFIRDKTTAETFSMPSSTVTNGLGAAWEYRRGGYSLLFNGTWYGRMAWKPWGPLDSEGSPSVDGGRTYTKYAASISRDFFFKVFHKIHLNASAFGGRDLDRFAKYQFGMFDDTRVHGVPGSGVRFADLAMARGSYSFNILDLYRLDLFLEQAWGRDRPIDTSWQRISGLGAAVNLRGPRNTILRADFGKSFLPSRYRSVGSTTLQILVLKPLR